MQNLEHIFYIDPLSLIMMGLLAFVGLTVASFSYRYLKGDRKQIQFYLYLTALISTFFVMVSADHILLLLVSWSLSNLILTRLMRHKGEWKAAQESSFLALKNFSVGLLLLGSAFFIFYIVTGETSIQKILNTHTESVWLICGALLIMLAVMTQSALWPFHRWLTSSLNSPTPVSAITHAGLINGGGFILVRFTPILSGETDILHCLFAVGMITVLLGSLWKLMQSDIKRTLACSTMSHMGFVVALCGLGLFPAAVAHLCWHGFFKVYLFLASGSAAQLRRFDLESPLTIKNFSLALSCGALGAYMFSLTSGKNIFSADTNLFLILFVMITGTQFVLQILLRHSRIKIPLY